MSVLKDARNLVLGNGDLFLATDESGLPSVSAYKTALNNGTLGTISGNVGAIKGTASIQIVRELAQFETGVPQEVGDQTCIREGIHFKCALAELSLGTIATQIGGGVYSTSSPTTTHVVAEPHTASTLIGAALAHGPVLYTTSVPSATEDPVVTLADTTATGASTAFTTSATGTGTLSPGSGTFGVSGVTVTVGGTAASGQVYSVVFGNGPEFYTVSYTANGGDTNNSIATNLAAAIRGVTGSGRVIKGQVAAAFSAPAPGAAVITVTETAFLEGQDFIIDATNAVLTLLPGGAITTGSGILVSYYYQEFGSELLTGGGQSGVTTSALRFFHPYKWGGVLMLTIHKANPAGTVTLPFEEIAYSHAEFEMRAIADFTRSLGDHLYELYRDVPQ